MDMRQIFMTLTAGCKIKPKDLFDIIEPEKKRFNTTESVSKKDYWNDEKNELIATRKAVNRLYFDTDITKKELSETFDVSTNFVVKWTQSRDQNFEEDDRGWEKGRRRKWDQEVVHRIREIREELEGDPDETFWGPTAIEVVYRKRYSDLEVPPARTIGQILTDLGLTDHQKHSSKPEALKYLHYPEQSLYQIVGDRVLEVDFVGDKFITGRSEPIHFLGYSFKRDPQLKHYQRVEGETSSELIDRTKTFFDRFETPQAVKMDNGAAMNGGGGRHKRTISNTMQFLLEKNVYPVFSVPRQPATQASIEGSNSLFSRKFWNRNEFESVQHIDERLEKFNENTRFYHQYEPPDERDRTEPFEPRVYFLRQVREGDEGEEGVVRVMNDVVSLSSEYIKYFVLAEWELSEEQLKIRFERREDEENQQEEMVRPEVIKKVDFPIHEASKKRCDELLS